MFYTKAITMFVLGGALAALPAFSQETSRSDVAVQAFGSFVKSTTQNGVEQSATNSGGVLASYRFFFSNSHGVERVVVAVVYLALGSAIIVKDRRRIPRLVRDGLRTPYRELGRST